MGYTAAEMNIYANKNRPSVITSKTDIWGLAVTVLYVLSRGSNVFQVTSEEKENLEASVTEKSTKNVKQTLKGLLFKKGINWA